MELSKLDYIKKKYTRNDGIVVPVEIEIINELLKEIKYLKEQHNGRFNSIN